MFRNKRKNLSWTIKADFFNNGVLRTIAEGKNEETKRKQYITENIRISIRFACGSESKSKELRNMRKETGGFSECSFDKKSLLQAWKVKYAEVPRE